MKQAVGVWAARIDDLDERFETGLALLSEEERIRAAGMRPPASREWALTRCGLRLLLGHLLGLEPHLILLDAPRNRQPQLKTSLWPPEISVSHSGGLAAYAVASASVRVGVDVERLRPVRAPLRLAKRNFAPAEAEAVASAPARQAAAVFLETWTRKEAVAKATGLGLRLPLDSFLVAAPPQLPEVLQAPRTTPLRRWQLLPLQTPDDYVGTIAIASPRRRFAPEPPSLGVSGAAPSPLFRLELGRSSAAWGQPPDRAPVRA